MNKTRMSPRPFAVEFTLAIVLAGLATASIGCSATNTVGSGPANTPPPIVLSPSGTDGIASLVGSNLPDQASPDYFLVGASAWTWNGEPGVQHGYLNFDLSSVPAGA